MNGRLGPQQKLILLPLLTHMCSLWWYKLPFPCPAADLPCDLCVETLWVGPTADFQDKGGTFLCRKDWQGAHALSAVPSSALG